MKASRDILAALLAAGAGLTAVPATTGCTTTQSALTTAPPARQTETVVQRPGYVWVRGDWVRSGRDWMWREGYYVPERPNQVYVPGYWTWGGRSYVWVEGGWRPRHVVQRP